MRAGAGREVDGLVDLVERRLRHALEQRDPLAQRLLEVDLAAHGPLGDLGDLGLAARVGGDHLDDLALDEGGVDVHDDEPHRAPQQAGRLYGDVDALGGGLDGEQRAQHLGLHARDGQVDGGDGIAGHPLDAVDVGAAVRDPAGDGRHRRRPERGAQHGDVRATRAALPVVADAAVDLDLHAQRGRGLLDGVAQLLPVPRRGDEDPEDEPAAQHDLLDVDDLDAGGRQGREHRGRDAGPVLAGQGHQEGLGVLVHVGHLAPEAIPVGRGAQDSGHTSGEQAATTARREARSSGAEGIAPAPDLVRRQGTAVVLQGEVDDRPSLQPSGGQVRAAGRHAERGLERGAVPQVHQPVGHLGPPPGDVELGEHGGRRRRARRAAPGPPRPRRAAGAAPTGCACQRTTSPTHRGHQRERRRAPRPRRSPRPGR